MEDNSEARGRLVICMDERSFSPLVSRSGCRRCRRPGPATLAQRACLGPCWEAAIVAQRKRSRTNGAMHRSERRLQTTTLLAGAGGRRGSDHGCLSIRRPRSCKRGRVAWPTVSSAHVCVLPPSCQARRPAGAGWPAAAFRLKSITGSAALYLEGSPGDRRRPTVSAGRQRVEQAGRGQTWDKVTFALPSTNMYGLLLRLARADGTERECPSPLCSVSTLPSIPFVAGPGGCTASRPPRHAHRVCSPRAWGSTQQRASAAAFTAGGQPCEGQADGH